jgi:quinol monooxygenase YgiN
MPVAPEVNQVCIIDWHVHPFRADRWFEIWLPAAERALAFGAASWTITRSIEDPLAFRQTSVWRDRADFERYWASDEVSQVRQDALKYYNKPALPTWHTLVAADSAAEPADVGEEVLAGEGNSR